MLLNTFTKKEAYIFIKKHLPNEHDSSIDVLAKKLHYFPLAIDQAVRYIQEHTNIDTYITLLKSNNNSNYPENNYTNALWSTWHLGFLKLSSNAKLMLVLSSYLDADKINLAYFKNFPLQERDSAIAELKNYSFITINNDGTSFWVHRLLQQVVRDKKVSTDSLAQAVNLLDFSFTIYQQVNKETYDDLMPHVLSLAQHEMETPSLFYNGLALYIQSAMYSTYVQEDQQQSKERWAKVLFLSTKRLSSENGFHYLLASINTHIGFNQYVLGEFESAEKTLLKTNDTYSRPLTTVSKNVETLLNVLRWSKDMSIKEGLLSDQAFALNALASTEFDLNKFDLSEQNYNKALNLIDQSQNKDKTSVYLVTYLQNLRRFYIYTNNLEKANLTAINLNQTHDPDLSGLSQSYAYERTGELYLFQGRYKEAENLFNQALTIKNQNYSSDNYRIGKTLAKLGAVLTFKGKPQEALHYLEKTKEIFKKHISESNINNLYLYFLIHYTFEKDHDYSNSMEH